MRLTRPCAFLCFSLVAPSPALAQSLDLTIHHTGISIGDSRFVRGIRLNFRDRHLEEVDGVNVTIWSPYEPATGVVNGAAIGLPLTGAREINGLGLGVFGVGADNDFTGLGFGGFGIGAGGNLRGIMIGGFGAGSGGNITGLTIGGFGAGSGGNVEGITIGGFGAGAGGNVTGLQIGGFGVGSGGNVTGITLGGFGAGAGGDVKGLTFGGFGAGAGGDITGITLAGFGAGSGGTVRGLAIAGIGVGAPRIRGIVLASAAGGEDVEGGIVAPFYFKVEKGGRVKGVTLSAFNHVKGDQYGLSLGLLNYAWQAYGWQFGVLNYVRDNPHGLRLLPLVNHRWK
ncbi:MAG TPA: hypothetical protein VJ867_00875 [Gemmatimonadaceae bacterium]|nr:hypothetical protein [Gemmatimonadaceae bacterium]